MLRFAGEGASVVIADLNRNGGEAAVRGCRENAGNAVFQLTDASSEKDIKGAINRAIKEFGRLDVIYNNAGLGGTVGSDRSRRRSKATSTRALSTATV